MHKSTLKYSTIQTNSIWIQNVAAHALCPLLDHYEAPPSSTPHPSLWPSKCLKNSLRHSEAIYILPSHSFCFQAWHKQTGLSFEETSYLGMGVPWMRDLHVLRSWDWRLSSVGRFGECTINPHQNGQMLYFYTEEPGRCVLSRLSFTELGLGGGAFDISAWVSCPSTNFLVPPVR
jgi:hypothetical protein